MNKISLQSNNQNFQFTLRDEADESVCNEIFKYREYRVADKVIINAKDPIVDVGAHAGFFSIYARALNPKVKIFAIEPEVNNIEALKNHIKINKIKDVKVVEGALAGETGARELDIAEDSHNHAVIPTIAEGSLNPSMRDFSTPLHSAQNDSKTMQVQAISFSDFCKQNKIKKISLMKLDIEGGEYEVFEAISETDLAIVNYVVLEYHTSSKFVSRLSGKQKKEELEEKLRINGFAVQVFPSKFDKTMGFIFAHNKRFR